MEYLIKEAQMLSQNGVKELILVAQETTMYVSILAAGVSSSAEYVKTPSLSNSISLTKSSSSSCSFFSYKDAPNVDGYVFIHTDENLLSGDMVKVKIESAYLQYMSSHYPQYRHIKIKQKVVLSQF